MELCIFTVVKHLTTFLGAILAFLVSGVVQAQEVSDYEAYARAAGPDIPLFRSRVADNYGNYYNGTYLADTLGFLPGTICFEGKIYENLSFDLDAVLQHVLMQRESSPIILDLGQERVSSFTRGSKTYVNLPALGYDVPAGFYERVAEGRGVIYKRVSKTLYHLTDLNHDARGFIGYDDPNYRSNLFDYYQLKELWYWIQEDGTVQRLKSKRKIKTALQAVQAHETH